MLRFFTIGVVFAFGAVVQPGPLQTFIISRALVSGWRHTWPAAFSPLLSDGPIAVLVITVLSQVPARFVAILQLAGSAFLLYLAFGAFNAYRRFDYKKKHDEQSGRKSLFKAAIINLLNPNPYIGWSLVMGPLVIEAWRTAPAYPIALLAGFYGTMVTFTLVIIGAASAAGGIGPRVSRALVGVSAICLAGFAFYQLWLGARGLSAA